ncbi:Putative transport protein YdiK [Oligella sp. MSHR50489EDL]|uniref:AI-2E family transporter n=1 Tax=Oligella sp. MSHR50489EDL TaxID=3139409 RepID=UPI003D81C140
MSTAKANLSFFVVLLILVTIGFIATIMPWFGSIFWAVIFTVIFWPLYTMIQRRMPRFRNLPALITIILWIFLALIPLLLITGALIREINLFYELVRDGQFNIVTYSNAILERMPEWLNKALGYFEITDLADIQAKVQASLANISRTAANQAVSVGQNALWFFAALGVMLYAMFFFFRDGPKLIDRIKYTIPLTNEYRNALFERFTTVVKATVKGNILVAVVQGTLGGIIFAFLGVQGSILWGVIMAFLSLLPAVGSALIWFPVAIYFLASGAIFKGVVLLLFGFFVIGLTDNVLRPILVGKSTKLPDWVILISTLGGLSVFGINGFVIGPLLAALFIVCWQLFAETMIEHDANINRVKKLETLEKLKYTKTPKK